MTAAIAKESVTLRHRLDEGTISLPESIRYATMLAEALRQVHDAGRACRALTPSNILLSGTGLELIPAIEEGAVTRYSAPETLQGRPADARSDIFAFGAIVYEMVTGRQAFAGDNADALAVSLTISVPPPTGYPAIDHLINHCIAKDPAARCPRMQKVMLELKLMSFAEAPARPAATAALRAETQQLEARMAVLLESHEEAMQLQLTTRQALVQLREQVTALQSELSAAQERSAHTEEMHTEELANLRTDLASAGERLARAEQNREQQVSNLQSEVAAAEDRLNRAEQSHAEQISNLRSALAAAEERSARMLQDHGEQVSFLKSELAEALDRAARAEQEHGDQLQRIMAGINQFAGNIQAIDQRIATGESNAEVLNQRLAMLQEYQDARLQEMEHTISSQAADLALVTSGQAQTDHLVEGVVAAMEVLQSSVFEFQQ
jgi:predicted  nucleic acid-binding Zn-ribbon protein